MSREINQVKVERDDGHKNRWAFGTWFYRQEGQKESLAGKRVSLVLGALFLGSIVYLLVRAPSQEVAVGEPISVEVDMLTGNSNIQDVPAVRSESSKAPMIGQKQNSIRYRGIEHVERPRLVSIPPGTTGEAKLLGAATDGKVRAELIEDVVFNGEVLLPKGAKLIGVGSSGEDRLAIAFSRVVFADGKTQSITCEAFDPTDQAVGLKGSKVSKYAAMVAAAGALSFAGGLAEGLQETELNGSTVVKKSNLKNATLNGAAHATIDASNEIVSTWKNKKSAISVKDGTAIVIVFDSN
jgi:hypothetical protein